MIDIDVCPRLIDSEIPAILAAIARLSDNPARRRGASTAFLAALGFTLAHFGVRGLPNLTNYSYSSRLDYRSVKTQRPERT